MRASWAASSSTRRRCTAAYAAASYRPRAIPDWFVTVTTSQPAWLSRRMASAAPGSKRTLRGSCRKPGSSTMVPSRSRNAARGARRGKSSGGGAAGIEGGPDRPGYWLDLVREDGAGVEHDAVVRDAGDDGWVRQIGRAHV